MKKEGGFKYFLFVSILVLALIIILFSFDYSKFTGKAISAITLPGDCSDSNVKALWDSIFIENSTGIRYNSADLNPNNNACDYIFAVKNISNTSYCLFVSNEINKTFLFAKKATYNSTDDQFNLSAINLGDSWVRIFLMFIMFPSPDEVNRTSIISDGNNANITFSSTFKKSLSSQWEQNITYGFDINQEYYSSSDSENYTISGENFSRNIGGEVFKTISDEVFIYSDGKINTSSCTPNWTVQVSSCFANETKITSYSDSNNCGTTINQPQSITNFCDHDLNGVIGSIGSIDTDEDISIFISGVSLNNSLNYTANNMSQPVEIKNNGTTIVSFSHNFVSSPMDLNEIKVKTNGDSSSFGYIIVNGINDTKSVILNKKNSSSNSVCVKDALVSVISDISSDCDEENEYIVRCQGTSSDGFTCSFTNSTFNISGLEHSAVKEIIETTCSANWVCSNWSTCTNLLKNRTCLDQNNCSTTVGRPSLTESCVPNDVLSSCTPNWTCDEWQPASCASGENQTRVCRDTSNCNTQIDKPNESQECEKTNYILWILIGLGILIFIMVIILVILFFFKKKPSSVQPPSQNQPPFQPPMQPIQTLQERQFPSSPQPLFRPQPIQQGVVPINNQPQK